jgi:dTDP-4-dehydrorhamnose reductase
MNVLITGAAGLVGRALQESAPPDVHVFARSHRELDIANEAAVAQAVRQTSASVVINAAAYRNHDQAQSGREAAQRVNAAGARALAEACRSSGAWLMHLSTAHVFDGAQSAPYGPHDPMRPINVYGLTKCDGERAVREILPQQSTIIRTSWLHAAYGRNFAMSVLDQLSRSREVRIVSDQIGVPTCSSGFAAIVWSLSRRGAADIFHWCDSGVASWYDFAVALVEDACSAGLLRVMPEVVPISSAEYEPAAWRPANCVLDKRATESCLGVRAPHWRAPLRAMIARLAQSRGA